MEALIIGLIFGVLWFLEKILGAPMIVRPLVVSPIVGFFLGDLETGIIAGATLELIFMGAMTIGAAVPPDSFVGAVLGTAFAIMSKSGPEVAITLAVPIAMLAQSVKIICAILRSWMMGPAMKLAAEAKMNQLMILHLCGTLLQSVLYFLIGFIAIQFGAPAVEQMLAIIPAKVIAGLQFSGGLLPAVGFAILLQSMIKGKNVLYFLFGFILVSYLKLPIMAITIIAIVLVFIINFESHNEGVISVSEEVIFDE